jgi:hypothetical protein
MSLVLLTIVIIREKICNILFSGIELALALLVPTLRGHAWRGNE